MRWRLLVDPPADGAFNMAVDESILGSALEGVSTVRLYRFHPPAVTFGYRQSLSDAVDAGACRELGIDVVRRITGGRALLHQHELTYSVAAPATDVFDKLSVRGVYRKLDAGLRRALHGVGVPLDERDTAAETRRDIEGTPAHLPCLSVPTGHEITVSGKKLVASAQRRCRRGFLQHGSILRRVDHSVWARICPGARAPLQAIGLAELLDPAPDEGTLVQALEASFETVFGVPAARQGLTTDERDRARSLAEKYRSELWNRHARLAHGARSSPC